VLVLSFALNGEDLVYVGGLGDQVFGGKGDDLLIAGAGKNLLDGGPNDDLLMRGLENNLLAGETGITNYLMVQEQQSCTEEKVLTI